MSEPAAPRPGQRRGNRLNARILALGALAGAIGAILGLWPAIQALWPDPDPENIARFTDVRVVSLVPLSEYQERVRRENRPAPVRQLQPDPSGSSQAETTTDTSAPDPPSSSSSDTTGSSSGSTSSTTETTSRRTSPSSGTAASVDINPPAGFSQEEFQAHVVQVTRFVQQREPRLDEDCEAQPPPCDTLRRALRALRPLVEGMSIGQDGKPIDPEVAAERIVELLRDTRRASDDVSGAGEPLGVIVTADIELIGLRGRPVLLSWEMYQQGGARRLHGDWLNPNLAYRLVAEAESDATTQNIWIPLPRSAGPFFVRVLAKADGTRLDSEDSEPFD
jgi:hypothetical protein